VSFRARLTLALMAVAAAPLAMVGYGVRREMVARLDVESDRRVRAVESALTVRLAELRDSDHRRLGALATDLAVDNRFRMAIIGGSAERRWLLDWAPAAMKSAGFAVLRVQDSDGRIMSSGQFRNEFDRLAPEAPRAVASTPARSAVFDARTPDGTVRALVTTTEFTVRGERFTLTGGAGFDSAAVAALSPDASIVALLAIESPPASLLPPPSFSLPYVDESAAPTPGSARFVLVPDSGPTQALKAGVERWTLGALGIALLVAALVAAVLGRVIAAPITQLADRTARLERTNAMGDVARQVNHDIKNGLAPIRNVLRHLSQTAESHPANLATVFGERRATLEAGLEYLDQLSRNYARLSPALTRGSTDPRPVVHDVARGVNGTTVDVNMPDALPSVRTDAVVLHRILDNLVSNAVDALGGKPGIVTIAAETLGDDGERRVRFIVTDTGRGMTRDELDRAFNDFYTTKPAGTGLGLSVVRRLLTDVGGSVRAETTLGKGSTFTVDIPAVPVLEPK
jgi:signal transduction histidine kinase